MCGSHDLCWKQIQENNIIERLSLFNVTPKNVALWLFFPQRIYFQYQHHYESEILLNSKKIAVRSKVFSPVGHRWSRLLSERIENPVFLATASFAQMTVSNFYFIVLLLEIQRFIVHAFEKDEKILAKQFAKSEIT